jgi:hypothetical protein
MAVIIWDAVDVVTITAGAEAAAITMAGGEDADGIGIDSRRFSEAAIWRPLVTLCY